MAGGLSQEAETEQPKYGRQLPEKRDLLFKVIVLMSLPLLSLQITTVFSQEAKTTRQRFGKPCLAETFLPSRAIILMSPPLRSLWMAAESVQEVTTTQQKSGMQRLEISYTLYMDIQDTFVLLHSLQTEGTLSRSVEINLRKSGM